MFIIKYLILGVICGITEILPISKLGHFVIFNNLFNTNIFNDQTLLKITDFATVLCIIIVYKNDLKKLLKKENFKYLKKFLILLLFPTIAFIFIKPYSFNSKIIGLISLIMVLLLFLVRNIKGHRNIKELTFLEIIILSFFSSLFVFPGISKIGIIYIFLKLRKLENKNLFKYSLILSIPLNLIVLIFTFIFQKNIIINNLPGYLICLIAAFITMYYIIKKSLKMKKNNLKKVIIYLLIFSLFTIIFV